MGINEGGTGEGADGLGRDAMRDLQRDHLRDIERDAKRDADRDAAETVGERRGFEQRGRSADRNIRYSFWIILWAMIAAVFGPLLQRNEAAFLPVVEEFRITDAEQEEDAVILSGDMEKRRDCEFVSLTFYAGDPNEPQLARERLHVEFLDQPEDADATRLEGRQSWGPWRLYRPRTEIGPMVFMRVTHSCHPFWPTVSMPLVVPTEALFPLEGCAVDPGRAQTLLDGGRPFPSTVGTAAP